MPLSSGTTIGRTPGRLLPGLLLRCCSPQVRPSVVPPADRRPGYCSDAAFFRYDHWSYPRQTTARAAAQMPLSAGATIGRTPNRPLPGLPLRCRFPQVRPSVVPPADRCPGRCSDIAFRRYDHRSYPLQTTARATAQMPLSSGATIGRTPGRSLPGLQLCYRFPQVRPLVVPPAVYFRYRLLAKHTKFGVIFYPEY